MTGTRRTGGALPGLRLGLVLATIGPAFATPAVAADVVVHLVVADARPVARTATVQHTHHDCVGPGLPGTAPRHPPETLSFGGFVYDGTQVRFAVATLDAGSGACPTTATTSPFPHAYSGRYDVVAVCRGGTNDGAIGLTLQYDAVAGAAVPTISEGVCTGPAGGGFSLDVRIAHRGAFGSPTDPAGGIRLTVTQ